ADVVKVEPPGRGDAFRTYGLRYEGYAAFWLNVNRGKRSVALDLKDPSDAQRCRELARRADVTLLTARGGRQRCRERARRADVILLTSRSGVLDDVGLDDGTLASLNPALVRVYVTGYGST